jgi:uncharacterized protein
VCLLLITFHFLNLPNNSCVMNQYEQNFADYTVVDSKKIPVTSVSKKFMASVFLWMFIALGISTAFAVAFATVPELRESLFAVGPRGMGYTAFGKIIAFAPLAFMLVISFGYQRLSVPVLTALFVVFSSVMGISLSTILWIYSPGSVIGCFASASAMFGVMAVMGYTTDKDLTSFGSLLLMGLIGVIIASMVNIFLRSETMYYIISFLGVAIFTGLTAYDVQKLKRIGAGIEIEGIAAAETKKLALVGALNLYLDFVNIFLYLLRLFGDKRK